MKILPNLLLILMLLSCKIYPTDKVLIITHSFDRPEFIGLQHKTFKAFLQDDNYEFLVMNDSPNKDLSNAITRKCQEFNIKCLRVPQQIHTAKRQHPTEQVVDTIQYTMNTIGFNHDGIVVIVDSDLFLIQPFSITQYLKGYSLAGHKQQRPLKGPARVMYLWQGLIFMDMRTLPNRHSMNFDCGRVLNEPVDAGGQLHHYIHDNPSLKIKYYSEPTQDAAGVPVNSLPSNQQLLHDLGYDRWYIDFILKYKAFNDPYSMEFHLDKTFIHYRAGGNWIHKPASYHAMKTRFLTDFINALVTRSQE